MKSHRHGFRCWIGLILTLIGVIAFVAMPLILLLTGCIPRNFGMGPSHNSEDAWERYSLSHTNL